MQVSVQCDRISDHFLLAVMIASTLAMLFTLYTIAKVRADTDRVVDAVGGAVDYRKSLVRSRQKGARLGESKR